MTEVSPQLRAAIDIVAVAGRVARAVQRDLDKFRKITKDDRSPVSVADFAVQAIVQLGLAEAEGKPAIVGEERAALLRDPQHAAVHDAVIEAVRSWRGDLSTEVILDAIDACDHDCSADAYWVLDPIDGTKGFLRGMQYAIALARIECGQVTQAVMGCPNLAIDQTSAVDKPDAHGSIYYAAAGTGAWELPGDEPTARPHRIYVKQSDFMQPIRATESVDADHSRHRDTARVLNELGSAAEPVRLDSQCKYAVVARGQADTYMRLPTRKDYAEQVWDHAPGMLIAMEAGAVVTDIYGAELDFSHGRTLKVNRGIVCALPDLHPRIIDAIERLGVAAAV